MRDFVRLIKAVCLALVLVLISGLPSWPQQPQAAPAPAAESPGEFVREPGRLWCNEHGRYEDRCFICHPELRDPNRPYCEKHFLYEDECYLCRPELKPKPQPQSKVGPRDGEAGTRTAGDEPAGAAAKRLMCAEHGVAEDECGICHPELAATIASGQGLKVRFGSPEAAGKAGVKTAHPTVGDITAAVDCYAEIVFNRNQLAEISVPVEGIAEQVFVDLGDAVAEGTVLATLSSAAIAEAVNDAVLAKQTLARERRLYADHISAQKEVQAAEAAHRTAHQRLRTLGFAEEQIDALDFGGAPSVLLEVRAPFAGEIVERHAVRGALVQPGRPLFVVVDRSTVWAMLNVPEADLGKVRIGQKVELLPDGGPGAAPIGTLTWIAASVDERTRMVQARAEIANPDGALRAGTFGRARILVGKNDGAVTVPRSAIQAVEGRPFAFVRLEDDLFEARPVELGAQLDGRVEVLAGVAADEEVVVDNAFLVKSQLQISRLGAGCTD
jgi:cobalt-zinc-cadmium efflux system membrane fusion protein